MNGLKDIRLDVLRKVYSSIEVATGSKANKLVDAFLQTIESGYWRPGDYLPTEKEFVEALPISLGTVQSALRRLTEIGVIERKRGVGTHLTDIDTGDNWYLRFIADDGISFLKTVTENIEIDETKDTGLWSAFIGERSSYIRVIREVSIDGEFQALAEVYLDGGRFRPLLDYEPRTLARMHVRHILHERFNTPTLKMKESICFLAFDSKTAKTLKVEPGTIGIVLDVVSYSFRDDPFCFQRFLIPPNNRRLDLKGQP